MSRSVGNGRPARRGGRWHRNSTARTSPAGDPAGPSPWQPHSRADREREPAAARQRRVSPASACPSSAARSAPTRPPSTGTSRARTTCCSRSPTGSLRSQPSGPVTARLLGRDPCSTSRASSGSTYLAHPAAASLSACRTTRRPAEMRAIDLIVGAVTRGRLHRRGGGQDVPRIRRLHPVLVGIGGDVQLPRSRACSDYDRSAWSQAYLGVNRADHPNIWQIRTALPELEDDEIFETLLSLLMDGLMSQAPKPCSCAQHSLQRPGKSRASA